MNLRVSPDIFKSIDDIYFQFQKIISLVEDKSKIIANRNDSGVDHVITTSRLRDHVTLINTNNLSAERSCVALVSAEPLEGEHITPLWRVCLATQQWGELSFRTRLTGKHNAANICLALGCIQTMIEKRDLPSLDKGKLIEILEAFSGVKRRLEHLGSFNNINIFEDFAHHPTAVHAVLDSFKRSIGKGRLIVAFEPKNATSRRSVFTKEFARALSLADKTFIGQCHEDKRIPDNERMNTKALKELIGDNAEYFQSNEDLLTHLSTQCKQGDTIIFMSSGAFSGIQHKLLERLKQKGIA